MDFIYYKVIFVIEIQFYGVEFYFVDVIVYLGFFVVVMEFKLIVFIQENYFFFFFIFYIVDGNVIVCFNLNFLRNCEQGDIKRFELYFDCFFIRVGVF